MNDTQCKPIHLVSAYHEITSHIEFFSADGASNEQVAGQLLHPLRSRHCEGQAKLPNLNVVIRGKAHASRRLSERTFCVGPLLEKIFQTVLLSPDSIARLLRFSHEVQNIFSCEV